MGKNTIKFIIILIMTTLSMGAFAQTETWTPDPQNTVGNKVIIGSTYKYRILKNMIDASTANTVTLTVENSSGGVVRTITDANIKTESYGDPAVEYRVAEIIFDDATFDPGTYTIEIVEENGHCPTTKTLEIEVVDNATQANWILAPGNESCADFVGTTLNYEIECLNGKGPWIVEYSINEDDDAGTTHPTITTTEKEWDSANNKVKIKIENYKVAPGQDSKVVTLTIISIKDKYGVAPNNSFEMSNQITIYRNPNTSPIEHD